MTAAEMDYTPLEIDQTPVLTSRWLAVDLRIKELQDEKAELSAALTRAMVPGGEARTPDGSTGVRLVPPRVLFSAELAERNLPAELYAAICRPAPSAALAKSLLADYPALLAQCQKAGEPFLKRL